MPVPAALQVSVVLLLAVRLSVLGFVSTTASTADGLWAVPTEFVARKA